MRYNFFIILSFIYINCFASETKYNMSVMLHCYDLGLLNEFIGRINNFMRNNNNNYNLVVTIPIDDNVKQFKAVSKKKQKKLVLAHCPYHKNLVNKKNIHTLYKIYKNIINKTNLDKNKIHIIFCENRGVDIGGFFLQLDYMFKNNINPDFIVKIHSKVNPTERFKVSKFLELDVNKYLKEYKSIYYNRYVEPADSWVNNFLVKDFFRNINLNVPFDPNITFGHSWGTMFITSREFLDVWRNQNLLNIFNSLPLRRNEYHKDVYFERYFGYIIDVIIGKNYLLSLDPISRKYALYEREKLFGIEHI